jgi:prevent-host-death family protein
MTVPKKGTPLVTKSIPAFIARTQFGQIMERVSQNRERFLVTKRGDAKAVILGVEDFLQAIVKTPKFLAALQEQAKKSGANTLTLEEIEAEIASVRRGKTTPQA